MDTLTLEYADGNLRAVIIADQDTAPHVADVLEADRENIDALWALIAERHPNLNAVRTFGETVEADALTLREAAEATFAEVLAKIAAGPLPTLSTAEAQARLEAEGSFTHEGFAYFNGAQLGSVEVAAAYAFDAEDGEPQFYPAGEPGTPITALTPWVKVF